MEDIVLKQKHHDKVLKKIRAILDKEKMDLVAFVSPDSSKNVMLRLVDYEDLDKFHKEVQKDIKKQIKEQIKMIAGKGDKIRKPKIH